MASTRTNLSGGRNSPRNHILAGLGADDQARLRPHLEPIQLEARQLVFDVDKPIEHVYFPEGSVVSILGVMSDGTAVETATVGVEGMVGLPVFLGTDRTSAQAFCQVPGPALRMPVDAFRAEISRGGGLPLALNRYTQALFTLVGQSSACNRLHTMTERCSRWLLHTHDRVGRDEFPLTHQFLSQMLGVRRATVTDAILALQSGGGIRYDMGVISVVDRGALERGACECYRIIVREFARLLSPPGTNVPPSPLDGMQASLGGETTIGDGGPLHRREDDI